MGEVDVSRRGNTDFAGRTCEYDDNRCDRFARYEVIAPESQEARLSCGTHLGHFVRITWVYARTAVLVKEVPGAWRSHGKD